MQFSPFSHSVTEVMGKIVDKNTPDEVLAELRLKHIGAVYVVCISIFFLVSFCTSICVPRRIHPARSIHPHSVHMTHGGLAGFVFQTFNLIATMSAFENVELPQIINGVDEDVRRERSIELLECTFTCSCLHLSVR